MSEKIILAVVVGSGPSRWSPEDEDREMRELITSCGGQVVQTVFCKTVPPTASHLLTKGKVEEKRTGIHSIPQILELRARRRSWLFWSL